MMHKFFLNITAIVLSIILLTGCSSTNPNVSSLNESDCSLQVQHSVTLSAIRFIGVMWAIQNDSTDQAVEDMDWWIDQAILQLQFLEEKYPEKQLVRNPVPGTDGTFIMKRLYRDIARYRNDNQRKHLVSLNSRQLEIIDKFVKNYK